MIIPKNSPMRFARLQSHSEAVPAGLENLASSGDLNYLQIDYARPRTTMVGETDSIDVPTYSQGFVGALSALAKTLFLEPQFHVITSAGWDSAYDCVEQAARDLVERGCGKVPVSAVRGSNLLPILEMLVAEGVDLRNAETGAPWNELRQPLLAADLEIGAGPLVTALAEGARIVVAGCYDSAAPAIAMAKTEFDWSWHDFDRLAVAAVASQAAVWCDWQAVESTPWQPPRIDLDSSGRFGLEASRADNQAAERLQQWLQGNDQRTPSSRHVDVRVDASAVAVTASGGCQLNVDGVRGADTDRCWRLDILFQAGFAVDVMLEFTPQSEPRMRRHIAEIARTQLVPSGGGGILTVDELQPLGHAGEAGWLHLAYLSKARKTCEHVLDQTLRLVTSHPELMRLATAYPAVHVHGVVWPARIPRGAVDIAVETRLAKEWM
jgi:hypothetical protein